MPVIIPDHSEASEKIPMDNSHLENLGSYIKPILKLLGIAKPQEPKLNVSRDYSVIGFDPKWYLADNRDVAEAGVNPAIHFEKHGLYERRLPHRFYSPDWHVEMNSIAGAEFAHAVNHLVDTRSDPARKRVAFFCYAWNSARRPDPYIRAIIGAINELGFNIDVYVGGQFAEDESTKGLRSGLNEYALGDYVRSKSYDFAISFNNALILPSTVGALECKIVSVIVDSIHHLFDHQYGGNYSVFKLPIHAAPIYTSLIDDLSCVDGIAAQFSFIPAATQVEHRRDVRKLEPYSISWIASLLGDHNLDKFTSRVDYECPNGLKSITLCLNDIAATGKISADPASQSAATILCDWAKWDYSLLEMHLQEIVTNRHRVDVVEHLAPLGLKLFGNARWRNYLSISPAIAQAFRSGANLATHSDICEVYDRSKISINLPQIHAGTGMQYRVLDILASSSLLITKYVPNSDLERIFGKDAPIVTFNDLHDLRVKCEYYLDHENERKEIVRECNRMISKGFSFRERVIEYLSLSNPTAASTPSTAEGWGSTTLIWPEEVIDFKHKRQDQNSRPPKSRESKGELRKPLRFEPTHGMLGGMMWSDLEAPPE